MTRRARMALTSCNLGATSGSGGLAEQGSGRNATVPHACAAPGARLQRARRRYRVNVSARHKDQHGLALAGPQVARNLFLQLLPVLNGGYHRAAAARLPARPARPQLPGSCPGGAGHALAAPVPGLGARWCCRAAPQQAADTGVHIHAGPAASYMAGELPWWWAPRACLAAVAPIAQLTAPLVSAVQRLAVAGCRQCTRACRTRSSSAARSRLQSSAALASRTVSIPRVQASPSHQDLAQPCCTGRVASSGCEQEA